MSLWPHVHFEDVIKRIFFHTSSKNINSTVSLQTSSTSQSWNIFICSFSFLPLTCMLLLYHRFWEKLCTTWRWKESVASDHSCNVTCDIQVWTCSVVCGMLYQRGDDNSRLAVTVFSLTILHLFMSISGVIIHIKMKRKEKKEDNNSIKREKKKHFSNRTCGCPCS